MVRISTVGRLGAVGMASRPATPSGTERVKPMSATEGNGTACPRTNSK